MYLGLSWRLARSTELATLQGRCLVDLGGRHAAFLPLAQRIGASSLVEVNLARPDQKAEEPLSLPPQPTFLQHSIPASHRQRGWAPEDERQSAPKRHFVWGDALDVAARTSGTDPHGKPPIYAMTGLDMWLIDDPAYHLALADVIASKPAGTVVVGYNGAAANLLAFHPQFEPLDVTEFGRGTGWEPGRNPYNWTTREETLTAFLVFARKTDRPRAFSAFSQVDREAIVCCAARLHELGVPWLVNTYFGGDRNAAIGALSDHSRQLLGLR